MQHPFPRPAGSPSTVPPTLPPQPISFVDDHCNQADMLVRAVCITEFLANVSPALVPSNMAPGLTEDACNGLGLILDALKNTVNAALLAVGRDSFQPTGAKP